LAESLKPQAIVGGGAGKEVGRGLLQQRHLELNDRTIVDGFNREYWAAEQVVPAEESFLGETIEADKQRVSRAGGKTLKGRVRITSRIEGKDLPEFLSGRVQKLDETISFGAEVADTVGPRETRRMK
jgi:hypothetical protein